MSLIPFLFWEDWVVGVVLKIMAILLKCPTFEGNIHESRVKKYIGCTENFETQEQGKTGQEQAGKFCDFCNFWLHYAAQKMMKVCYLLWGL